MLHVLFNMMALVPLGSELERIMGSIRLLYLMFLLALSNAIFHLTIALLAAYNPLRHFPYFMEECAIGFSGIIFSMIVIETSLSGAQSRSVFGLFNIPSKWYPWILLLLFQLLATNVSLLGHLCGILSGFAYTHGFFNYLLPGPMFYSAIENSSMLASCVRRPKFILCSGGASHVSLPTHNTNTPSSGLVSGNMWRNLSSWMPQREVTAEQPTQDSRFPGRGRTLGSIRNHAATQNDADSDLQARLLDDSTYPPGAAPVTSGRRNSDVREVAVEARGVSAVPTIDQGPDSFEEDMRKLVAMGFEKTQVEVALTAADGDPNVAVEILMSQQT
ncbi:Uncharacterized protein QJS10_CPB19g01227 [Acorus calamus]|uniref:UBA domain-containing protein n=1 Tax=Acorus calamus TaxID=4465 RepID=A0AAV9CL53_ACOCL|nr:Uncharacterized protein QJS10_CPB19g01227 [Acorus calamus]